MQPGYCPPGQTSTSMPPQGPYQPQMPAGQPTPMDLQQIQELNHIREQMGLPLFGSPQSSIVQPGFQMAPPAPGRVPRPTNPLLDALNGYGQ